jgi:hypothetical protein
VIWRVKYRHGTTERRVNTTAGGGAIAELEKHCNGEETRKNLSEVAEELNAAPLEVFIESALV